MATDEKTQREIRANKSLEEYAGRYRREFWI
jgi:hypothetical protein